MTRKEALTAVRAKVEAGTLQYNDADIIVAVFDDIFNGRTLTVATIVEPDLNGVAALHEAVLPGWGYLVSCQQWVDVWKFEPAGTGSPIRGIAAISARAWLIAIIKALIAQEDDA